MIKVGIIGLGGIARQHCLAIAGLDNVEIVAVADLFEENRASYMETYGIPRGYRTHTELLEDDDVEAVAVVLGHTMHHRLTMDALQAGRHVLVEKPMALNLEQCDEMIETAHANDVKLMLGHTQHFLPTSVKAKEILDAGTLGPLVTSVSYMSKRWGYEKRRPQYRSRHHGGGMWITNGVHVVDRLMWVMGSQAVSVSAAIGTRSHYQAGDDHGTALIRCKNGLAGVAVCVGYADGGPNHECQVICANGGLRFNQSGEGPFVQIGRNDTWEDVPFEEPDALFHYEWQAFAKSIEEDLEPPVPGEWGRSIMEILFAAEESAVTGREVLLDSGRRWVSQERAVSVIRDHGWV